MNINIVKENDPLVQPIKQKDTRLYEALRKPDRINVPILEMHGFGIDGDISVGQNLFPPIVLFRDLQLTELAFAFRNPPTGADAHVDIRLKKSGCSILKKYLIFPDGFTDTVWRHEFGINTFKHGDVLLCDVLQIGSSTPGSYPSITMSFNTLA